MSKSFFAVTIFILIIISIMVAVFIYSFNKTDIPKTNFSEMNKSQIIECPDGFILDKSEKSFVTNNYICKPEIMNLVAPNNVEYYLSDKLPGNEKIWGNWEDYPPLVQKVNELIKGKTNDLDKVKAIANWVHKSKNYSCSIFPPPPGLEGCINTLANNDANFSDIFENDKGVCMDAAVITTAMLRAAGIPAIPRKISSNFHIVTMYYLDGLWYSIDTTFCFDKTKCPDLNFMSPEDAKQTIYFLDNRIGHFKNAEGKYCENDFCLDHPFVTNKIMPLNDKSFQATLIYPGVRNMNIDGNQIHCYLEFKDMFCSTLGCGFGVEEGQIPIGGDIEFNRDQPIVYEIEDMENIGYSQILLPSKIKFLGTEGENVQTLTYNYVCKQIVPNYRPIAYKQFSLKQNQKLIITYSDLQKSNQTTDKEFELVINNIKSVTIDLEINP